MTISCAKIQFNQQGTPVATEFDDVYFSNADGIAESQYVFLRNNDLPQRWLTADEGAFVIAETGFGTGLNFLVTLEAYLSLEASDPSLQLPQLYFISTEKFPLTKTDLSTALAYWPALGPLAAQLVSQYPADLQGCHRLQFAQKRVVLDLWLGDIDDTLPQINSPTKGAVDAWFLDGFAPSKNPQMWSDRLFRQMARLSKDNSTFATFTAAGIVRRGLSEVGFKVAKRKGFGTKREMLAGRFASSATARMTERYFYRHCASSSKHVPSVAVIGAGLAGANLAAAFARKGLPCTLYCMEAEVAAGASGNPQGGFYPQLNASASILSQLQASSFLYAQRQYTELAEQGFDFSHSWCGVLQLSTRESVSQRHDKITASGLWPKALVRRVNASQASEIAGISLPYGALYLPLGGWVCPPELVKALIAYAQARVRCEVKPNHQLTGMTKQGSQWCLHWQDGDYDIADIVIMATGAQRSCTLLETLPLRVTRGQVEAIPTQPPLSMLRTVLCHKGYLTPAHKGSHALGSTYVKDDHSCAYRTEEEQQNLAMHQQALAELEWPAALVAAQRGRAALRCNSPDHLPLVGAVPDIAVQRQQYRELYKAKTKLQYPFAEDHSNLFMLAALGSRGLTTAPLMAELLVSQIMGHPLPLPQPILNALSPNRFMVRDLIRQQPTKGK